MIGVEGAGWGGRVVGHAYGYVSMAPKIQIQEVERQRVGWGAIAHAYSPGEGRGTRRGRIKIRIKIKIRKKIKRKIKSRSRSDQLPMQRNWLLVVPR